MDERNITGLIPLIRSGIFFFLIFSGASGPLGPCLDPPLLDPFSDIYKKNYIVLLLIISLIVVSPFQMKILSPHPWLLICLGNIIGEI